MSNRGRFALVARATVLSLAVLAGVLLPQPAAAAVWSNTELHIQFGDLDLPEFFPGAPTGESRLRPGS